MPRALAAALALVVVASGCATRGSVRRLEADLAELQNQVVSLRVAQDRHAQEMARLAVDIRGLEPRVRDLGSGISAAGDTVRQLGERVVAVEGVMKNVRTESTGPTAPPAPPPLTPAPAPSLAPAPAPTPAAPPAVAAAPRREPARADGAEGAFQMALANFRAREHGQAVLELLDFLAKHPTHPLAPNAQYWIGEAYYIQRDYRQALVEFQKVIEHGGANGKAADALLKMGLCYQSLREPVRAEQVWQRVVRDYADSDAASRARALLRRRVSR
jgi:tol-pal system protein YbgF